MIRKLSARRPVALATLLVAGAATALSACAGASDKPSACPRYGILSDATKMTQFRPGPGRDVVDVVYTAEVPRVALQCTGDDKKVDVTVRLQLVASPGPAAPADGKLSVPFFVALTRDDREVVAREIYTSDFEFKPGERGKAVTEEAEITIPLGEDGKIAAYEVLVGLKLDHAQLDYNRTRRPG
jgi:hypothetical protein